MICNYLQIQSMHVSCQHYDWHALQLWWSWKKLKVRSLTELRCFKVSPNIKFWKFELGDESFHLIIMQGQCSNRVFPCFVAPFRQISARKCMTDSWFKIDEFFIPAIHFHCLESRSLKIMPVTRVFFLHCCLLKNRKFNIHSCQFSTRRQIFHFELNRRLHIR